MTNPPLALATPPPTLAKYSTSIPFLRRPRFLTGRFAGDVGFDPLGFASSMEQLVYYREAEVKHSRIAMLVSCLLHCVLRVILVICLRTLVCG